MTIASQYQDTEVAEIGGGRGGSSKLTTSVGLTERIIGLAIKVHRRLGPGLLESIYEQCLGWELGQAGLMFARQVPLAVVYEGLTLPCAYRADMIVEQEVIVEVKSVDRLLPVHEAQLLTYLRLSECRVGLLMNFNTTVLKDGLRRRVAGA